jgi:hypothetical protein
MPLAGQTTRALDWPPAVQVSEGTDELNIVSTSYIAGGTPCAVTFTAPSSGRVLVYIWARLGNTDGTNRLFVSYQLREGSVSGTIIRDAGDSTAVQGTPTAVTSYGMPDLVDGLTAGGTYYIRTMHKVAGGAAVADIFDRRITVTPEP